MINGCHFDTTNISPDREGERSTEAGKNRRHYHNHHITNTSTISAITPL